MYPSSQSHSTITRATERELKLVIQWPRLGPYHIARTAATTKYLQRDGLHTIALETASMDRTYGWPQEKPPRELEIQTLFPESVYEEVPTGRIWREIFEKMNKINPDILAICGYQSKVAQALFVWSKLRRRSTILMTASKEDDVDRRSKIKELVKREIVIRFDAALSGGELQRDYLVHLGMDRRKIFFGYDVVDNDYFYNESMKARTQRRTNNNLQGISNDNFYFLASSRFVARKNLPLLLRAYSRYRKMCEHSRPWNLIVLGDGEQRPLLEDLLDKERIQGVTLPGFRVKDDLPVYYGHAQVFIHPALQEQWGLVVNEAMAAGLPVLVSQRCGCVPELVHDGVNGFTFDAEDEIALAELMYNCSTGQFDLEAMGRESLAIIGEWGPQRFAKGMRQAIEVAISG